MLALFSSPTHSDHIHFERTCKMVVDVTPLAFTSGAKADARVIIRVATLPSGPLRGVELEWDGTECHPVRYMLRRIRREETEGVGARRLSDEEGGETWSMGRGVAFCRRARRA
jgi:hypothetical protein